MATKGTEKRLTNIPGDLSELELKYYLGQQFKTTYDFRVVFDKSAEAVIWEAWEDDDIVGNATKTARFIVPTPQGGVNITAQLGSLLDVTTVQPAALHLGVEAIANIETPDVKFEDLLTRKFECNYSPNGPPQTTDWILGDVLEVQFGNFVRPDTVPIDTFQKEGAWSVPPDSTFNKFSFFGDQWPSMFQVCLQDLPDQNDKRRREWMDLHIDDNIRGIIFDTSSTAQVATVWIVVDKPPQFYQRTQKAPAPVPGAPAGDLPAWAVGPGRILTQPQKIPDMIKARIRYPSQDPDPIESQICGVPSNIQYSRVFKIAYKPLATQNFTFDTFKGRLSTDQQDKIILLQRNIPVVDGLVDSVKALKNNMAQISSVPHDCQLAFLKLIYNCNLPVIQGQIEALRQVLNAGGTNLEQDPQLIADLLEQSAHNMETSHVRSLRRLHVDASKKLPTDLNGRLVEPVDAVRATLSSPNFTERDMRNAVKPSTFKIMVFPSHVEIFGPEIAPASLITETYKDKMNRLIRVRFLDNDGNPFKIEPGINADLIINERILSVLNGSHRMFTLSNCDFEFLGYSVSSLKKRKMVWFFRKDDNDPTTSKTIRDNIGIWDAVKNTKAAKLAGFPFKWGARMALAFTSSIPICEITKDNLDSRDDVPEGVTFPNTDGCGIISSVLGDDINTKMQDMGYNGARAFQIRLGGVKGVVYQAPDRLFDSVTSLGKAVPKTLLRSSNIKFDIPENSVPTFRVVSTTGDFQRSLFFESLVQALENLNADPVEILKAFDDGYGSLTSINDRTISTLQSIVHMTDDDRDAELMSRYGLLKLAANLGAANIGQNAFGENSFLTLYLRSLSRWAMNKNLFAIPVPGSFSTLGLTDDFEILVGKVEANLAQKDNPYEVIILANKKFVSGEVLIYRDPIIHIGDLKIAMALTEDEIKKRLAAKYVVDANAVIESLSSMDNVIFFSQGDRPPLPNRLSGGDLDGDRFEIIPKDGCKFWTPTLKDENSDDYAAEPDKSKGPQRLKDDFNINDLTTFIGQYIRQDCFDELQTTLTALADTRALGLKDPDVMEFSTHISNAVDYAKSGVSVDLWKISQDPKFKVTAKPDILRARNLELRYSHDGDYYQSTKLLGKIYQKGLAAREALAAIARPAKLDNQPLAQQIDADCKKSSLSNGNLEEYTSKVRGDIRVFVEAKLAIHREYLKGRNVAASSEIDVFMTKPRDANFPEAHINSIVYFIKLTMVSAGALQIELDPDRKARGYSWKLAPGISADDTAVIFKQCAYEAWKNALALSGEPDAAGEYAADYGEVYTVVSAVVQSYLALFERYR